MKKTRSSSTKSNAEFQWVTRSKDLPATQGMLQLVRTELKSDIRGLKADMNSKFEQVLSEVSRIGSEVSRMGFLAEEQNSKNNVVLEGLTSLWGRQKRIENRVDDIEKTVRSIARSRP